jgi:hypothetical protein
VKKALALLAVVACAGACKRAIRYQHHELAGLSFDLPTGDGFEINHEEHDYTNGELSVIRKGNSVFTTKVQWAVGATPTPDDAVQIIGRLTSVHLRTPTWIDDAHDPDGRVVRTIRSEDDDHTIFLMTSKPCGQRALLVITAAADPLAAHQHVVGSLVCRPDAAKEAQLARFRVTLALSLPGWKTTSHEANVIELAGHGNSYLLMSTVPSQTTLPELREVVGPMLKDSVSPDATLSEPRGEHLVMTGTQNKKPIYGFARVVTCPTGKLMVLAFSGSVGASDQIEAKVTNARCLHLDEPPPEWPPADLPRDDPQAK